MSQLESSVCTYKHLSSALFQLIQQAYLAYVLLNVQLFPLWTRRDRKREKQEGEEERVRVALVDECFEFVWRRGTGMRQEPVLWRQWTVPWAICQPNVCASFFFCVFHAQSVVRSNHDLHIKVEVSDDRDSSSCLSPSGPLLSFASHTDSVISELSYINYN